MADRYVNYDKLLEERHRLGLDEMSKIHKVNAFNQFIDNLPTADVVEVVKCKDCRHWIKTGYDALLDMGYGYCYNDDSPFHCEERPCTSEKYFCGSGERRTDNEHNPM